MRLGPLLEATMMQGHQMTQVWGLWQRVVGSRRVAVCNLCCRQLQCWSQLLDRLQE